MKAMVFAAGLGSRLGSITDATPKCLIDVGGITMLEHVIERLKQVGVTTVIINLFHRGEMIERFCEEKKSFGIIVHFSREKELLDTGGGLFHARRFFEQNEDFFVHNSDVYSEIPLDRLRDEHLRSRNTVTIAAMKRESSRALRFDEAGLLVGWERGGEKAPEMIRDEKNFDRLPIAGIHMVSSRLFSFMPSVPAAFPIVASFMKAAAAGERVACFRADGAEWIDMGTPANLAAVRNRFKG